MSRVVTFAALFIFSMSVFAQTEPPQFFTLDGRLFNAGSDTDPLLDSNIAMTIQVLDPAKTCVLYEEQQNISTLATNGYFSVRVGSAIGSPKRTGNDVGNSLAALFYNSGVAISGDGGCNYTPAAGDERYFRFFITPSTVGATSQLSPDMSLDSVPQAIVAQTLQGLGPTDIFRTSATSTQAKLDNLLTTNYTALTDLVGGASTLYLPSTAEGTQLPSTAADPVAPVAGQVWYNSTSNELKYFNGTVVETLTSGGAGGTVTSVATGAGLTGGPITASGTISIANSGVINAMLATGIDASKITVGTLPAGVVPTGTDDTKLPLLGGTMTGALDMGAQNVLNTGHITMNALRTITIGRFTAAEQAALVGTLGAPNAGATWFNSDTGKLMYWTGAAAREVSEMTTAGGDITSVVAGTGLTGGALTGAATLNVDIGTSAGQLFTIDSVPPCSATQKLQMTSGPIYLWSCENESVPSLVADADSDTRIRTEAAADEDVLRFDTAGSERMVIDATGNVGIGTTAPLSKLDVNGGVAIGTFAGTAAAPSNGLSVSGAVRFGQETGVSNIYNQYTGLFTYVPKMQVSGTISDSASILVASSQLNVAGPNMVFAHSRGLTAGAQGVLQTGDELGVLNFQGSDGTNFLSSSRISSNVVGTPAAGDLASELRFLTRPVGGNISQRMVIASDGNVGIGTTVPTSALNIFSTAYPPLKSERSVATVATKTTSALFQTTTSADMVDNFGTQIDFGIKDTSGVDNKLASIGALRRGADNTGAMIFETSVAGTANERMRISESGNIGIGTTNPAVSLDLNTKTDAVHLPAGTDAQRPVAANGMIRYNTTSNKFEGYENGAWVGLREAASGTVVAAGNGAVGAPSLSFSGDPNTGFYSNGADVLGVTTNGVNRFNISSAGLVSSTTGGGLVTSGNGTAAAPTFSFSGDPDTGWWRPTDDTMAASTAGVERMRIDANGNIGVGTTTASSALHIKKPTTAGVGVLVQGGTSNTNDHMQWQSSAGVVQGVIDYNGQVGLGTTAPLSPLHVYSTTANSLTFERSTGANANIQYKNTVGSMYAGLSPTAFFGVGSTSDLAGASFAVLPSGNVGIGTTNPTFGLTYTAGIKVLGVAGDGSTTTSSGTLAIGNSYSTASANDPQGSVDFFHIANSTAAMRRGARIGSWLEGAGGANGYGANLRFFTKADNSTGASERVRVDHAGNVGIGTSSPQAPLHVAGNIRLNGPDLNLYNSVRCQSDVTDSLGYCDGTGRAFAHEAGDVLHINFSNDFDGGLRFNGGGAQMLGGNFYLGGGPYTVNNSYTLGQSSSRFQLSGVDAHGSGMSGLSFQNSGAGPNITLGHSRGGTIGTQAILNSGDELGAVSFQGSDGTKFIEGAKIYSVVSGASALDNLAADIRFQTRAAGGSGVATRMTIGTSGNVGIGTTNPTANLTVSGDSPTFNMDGYWTGNGPVLVGRRARGTVSVPLATQVGDQLLFVGGRGYGDTAFASASSAAIVFSAGENFTDTAQGANISFATTPLGAPNTSRVERMRITESGNVGIGTTNPAVSLDFNTKTDAVRLPAGTDAQRPAAANGMIRYNTTSNKFEGYENGAWVGLREAASGTLVAAGNGAVGAPSLSFSGDPNTGFYSNGADVLGVTTNGVNRFNISSGGLVSSTTGGGLVTSGNGTAAAPTFSFSGDPDTGWWRPTDDTMAASTAGVERMRIDSSGNVGIGISAPIEKLQLDSGEMLVKSRLSTDNAVHYGIKFTTDNEPYYSAIRANRGSTSTRVGLSFFTTHGVAPLEAARISSEGNVGIGTTTPQYKLTTTGDNVNPQLAVYGNDDKRANIYVKDGVSYFYGYEDTPAAATPMGLGGSATSPWMYMTSGNVGIGTTAPGSILDINGAETMRGMAAPAVSTAGQGRIYFDSTSNKYRVSQNGGGYVDLVGSGAGDGHSLDAADGSPLNVINVDNDGKVGIGTTSPSVFFEVIAPLNNAVKIVSGSADVDDVSAQNITLNAGSSTLSGTGSGGNILLLPGVGAPFGGSNGKVGVNTTSPTTRLHVRETGFLSTANVLDIMRLDATTGGTPTTGFGSGLIFSGKSSTTEVRDMARIAARWTTATDASRTSAIGFSALTGAGALTEQMTILGNGNVGIGTTTPGNKLEVVSTTNAESTVRISRTDDTLHRNELQFKPAAALSATNVAWLLGQSVNTDTFHVKSWDGTTATHRFVLDRDGNVGIGTSTPSQKLHVVGNLRVQGSTDCTLGNGAGGTNCSSDRRLKTNIRPIQNVIDKILAINGVEFEWNEKSNNPGDSAIGVIAQDVEKQFPTAVIEDADSGYKKVDYAVLVAPLIEAFKNLHTKILELFKLSESQSRQIASLKQQTTTDSAAKDHQIAKLKAEIEKQKNETAILKQYICSKDPQAALCKQ